VNSSPPKPEVILTNFFAEPTVLLLPIPSRDFAGPEKLVSCLVYIDQLQISWFCKEIREDNFRFWWRRVHEDTSQGLYMSEIEIFFFTARILRNQRMQNQLFCLCRLPAVILLDLKNLSRVLYILINCKLLISRGILYYI
jgi:hypothetical protein